MLVDTYFARQPILDRRRNVCAYEVLYRGGPDSTAAGVVDGESATAQVLAGAFNDLDLPDLLAGRPGFVNLPRETILERALSRSRHRGPQPKSSRTPKSTACSSKPFVS